MNNNLKIVFNCITQKYFKFKGRASKKEFWSFLICSMLLMFILEGIFFILSILASSGYILKDTSFLLKLSINSLFVIFFTIPCCAPGILVHPCARREVHFILTFLLHFVILHFKFRYKVFSIRIPF